MGKTIVCAFVEDVPQEDIFQVFDALKSCGCTVTKVESAGHFKLAVSYYFYGSAKVAAIA